MKKNKLVHPDFEIKNNDEVFYETSEGVQYAVVAYQEELFAYVLINFPDKTFKQPSLDSEGNLSIDFLYEVGIDSLERVEDYDFEELD